MDKPNMEWIDRIFNCMELFYGERWAKQFDHLMTVPLAKTLWQSALTGCKYDEIRSTLVLLKRAAQGHNSVAPNYLEFFRYAKGSSKPHINYERIIERGDPEIARAAMQEINAKLRGHALKNTCPP